MGALGGRQGCGDTGCTVPPMRRGRGSAFGPRLSLMPGPTGLHIPRLPSGTAASGPHPAHSPGRQNQCLLLPPGPWAQPWAPTGHLHRPSLWPYLRGWGTQRRECMMGGAAGREPRQAEGRPPPWGGSPGRAPSTGRSPPWAPGGRAWAREEGAGPSGTTARLALSTPRPPASVLAIRPAERRGPPLLPETPQDEDCPAAPCHPGCGHCAR